MNKYFSINALLGHQFEKLYYPNYGNVSIMEISNSILATGLKIVGMGACLPWSSISSSYQNSLKTSGH